MEIYLDLSKKGLKKTEKRANEESVNISGDEGEDELVYSDLSFQESEKYLDEAKNTIQINGDIFSGEVKLGWIDVNVKLDFDLVVEIIEFYRKKLGKLKTVLEATKDEN